MSFSFDRKWMELLDPYKRIALAVSGGSDSIFMLHHIQKFASKNGKQVICLSVNHNLRDEAKAECEFVRNLCQKLGIEHKILEWIHNGISSNIHDRARKARYDLMTNYCKENNIDTLLTAHHMDDRIENFFIRIYRGSGLLGLVDKEQIIYNELPIIRPIFDISKEEIIQDLESNNIDYMKDSSNEDPKYLRSNIRKWLSQIPSDLDQDLFKKRVISVKENLARSAEIIEAIYSREFEKNVEIFNEGYAKIKALTSDKDVAYMTLAEVLKMISGDNSQIRLDSIKTLYAELSSKKPVKKTLAGCFIEKKDSEVIIYREFGKAPPEDIPLENGAIWDGRFEVLEWGNNTHPSSPSLRHPRAQTRGSTYAIDPRIKSGDDGREESGDDGAKEHNSFHTISYLKESEYAEIKDKISLSEDLKRNKKIIFTIPVLKYLEKVIAIPHINYYDDAYNNLHDQYSFEFKRINNE